MEIAHVLVRLGSLSSLLGLRSGQQLLPLALLEITILLSYIKHLFFVLDGLAMLSRGEFRGHTARDWLRLGLGHALTKVGRLDPLKLLCSPSHYFNVTCRDKFVPCYLIVDV